jgi:hypothetical protein
MTKYGNITLITTLTLLTLYQLCLLLIVRLGGYIVNLSDFYSYRFIGQLTSFLQLRHLKNRVVLTLVTVSVLRITLNPPHNPVYVNM